MDINRFAGLITVSLWQNSENKNMNLVDNKVRKPCHLSVINLIYHLTLKSVKFHETKSLKLVV